MTQKAKKMNAICEVFDNKNITDVLPSVLEYSGKGFVCDKGELYLHHAFHFMTQFEKECCENKVEHNWSNPKCMVLIGRAPQRVICAPREDESWGSYSTRRKELRKFKKAMKYIMDADSSNPFIRFRVGKMVRHAEVEFELGDESNETGIYVLGEPYIETEDTLRMRAKSYYRDLEMALEVHRHYDPLPPHLSQEFQEGEYLTCEHI